MTAIESHPPRAEILPLTGLRFIAAFYVFIFHMQIRWSFTAQPQLANVLSQGAVGMSVFFMLSGFVLAFQYVGKTTNFRQYLINRIARIYPVYIVAALITLPWIGITLFDSFKNFAQFLFLLFSDALILQAWFPKLMQYWNNGASWSISVEAFCYLLLPLLLAKLKNCPPRSLYYIAAIAFLLALLPGFSILLYGAPGPGIFYSMPIFRLPEFIMGICVCLLFQQRGQPIPPRLYYLQNILLFLLVADLAIIGPRLPEYTTHDLILLPTLAVTLYTLASARGWLSQLLSSRPMVYLGRISYCFYSFQMLIITALIHDHDNLVQRIPLLAHNSILALIAFLAILILAIFGHHFIEEPARLWIKRRYALAKTGL